MARSKKSAEERGRSLEIAAVLLVFAAVFSLISILSYHSGDPSWGKKPAVAGTENVAGRIGSHFAEPVLLGLGAVALLLPLSLGYLGVTALFPGKRKRLPGAAGRAILLIAILSPLLVLAVDRFRWGGGEFYAGGLFGKFAAEFLKHYLNTLGSWAVLSAALLFFVLLSTRWSPGQTAERLQGLFHSAFQDVRIKVTRYGNSRKKEKMRRKIQEKYAAPQKQTPPPAPIRKEAKKTEKKMSLPAKPAEDNMLFPDLGKRGDYHFPPFSLLDLGKPAEKVDTRELSDKKQRIEEKLGEFGVAGEVREYHPGPVITTYEFFPAAGIKVSQVANLTEELSLALEAESVRIQRIPGKSSLGIEIPNNKREDIRLRDILQSRKFMDAPSKLTIALGKTVHGEVYLTDLAVMPHLLIAGATGTGKSVALNTLIASILYKATPDEVKLILIDPKRLEFSLYEGIPHLLAPVVNDAKKAGIILIDIVKKMEDRLRKLGSMKVRNIEQYNQTVSDILADKKSKLSDEDRQKLQPLPFLVVIIDELAELMMVGAQEVEASIARLAQLARAVGIHLVMATQRPSIDVITGTIKNNFTSRIGFRVPTKIDSRVIIDTVGAEKLLGKGDMLFLPPNFPRLLRLHCSYISIPEVRRLVKHVKDQGAPVFDERILQVIKGPDDFVWDDDGEKDPLFDKAVELVLLTGQASASNLQRKMKLGYARAARIIDQMENDGIVGPADGSKPREILVDPKEYLRGRRQTGKDS
jgi:DNA segregation ATPase FtsK/SpoIIIE, S-DNA-T family